MKTITTIDVQELEQHRAFWTGIARQNGWYTSPFHIVAWADVHGHITDSVSHKGLERDVIVEL